MEFKCLYCGHILEAEKDMAGQQSACPACSKTLTVPEIDKASASVFHQSKKNVCPGCGTEVKTGAVICVNCGYDFRSRQQIPVAPQTFQSGRIQKHDKSSRGSSLSGFANGAFSFLLKLVFGIIGLLLVIVGIKMAVQSYRNMSDDGAYKNILHELTQMEPPQVTIGNLHKMDSSSLKTQEELHSRLFEDIQKYSKDFPKGRHTMELDDLCFAEVKKTSNFQQYMKLFPKGRHIAELDDLYFYNARTSKELKQYAEIFPTGKHLAEVGKIMLMVLLVEENEAQASKCIGIFEKLKDIPLELPNSIEDGGLVGVKPPDPKRQLKPKDVKKLENEIIGLANMGFEAMLFGQYEDGSRPSDKNINAFFQAETDGNKFSEKARSAAICLLLSRSEGNPGSVQLFQAGRYTLLEGLAFKFLAKKLIEYTKDASAKGQVFGQDLSKGTDSEELNRKYRVVLDALDNIANSSVENVSLNNIIIKLEKIRSKKGLKPLKAKSLLVSISMANKPLDDKSAREFDENLDFLSSIDLKGLYEAFESAVISLNGKTPSFEQFIYGFAAAFPARSGSNKSDSDLFSKQLINRLKTISSNKDKAGLLITQIQSVLQSNKASSISIPEAVLFLISLDKIFGPSGIGFAEKNKIEIEEASP